MNVLDEDISATEREHLRAQRLHVRQVGIEVGRLGMKDRSDIIPLLHALPTPTFFSRDHGFYHPRLLHAGYCLVYLDVAFDEVAKYVRQFLRHPRFRTQSQRMGKVVRVRPGGISYWQMRVKEEHWLSW